MWDGTIKSDVAVTLLTGKMVVETDLCQKVLERHTNAVYFDRVHAQISRLQQLGKGVTVAGQKQG